MSLRTNNRPEQLVIRLPSSLRQELKRRAEQAERSLGAEVRMAIRHWIAAEKGPHDAVDN